MRDRSWRRYTQDNKVKKRLIRCISSGYYRYRFYTADGRRIINPIWCDYIGLYESFFFRLHTTSKSDSKHKVKYSPNSNTSYYRDNNRSLDSLGTRELDKRDFFKIRKENGLR
jgi:hypothetical protein